MNLISAVIESLGWTFLHFLWQGTLVGCGLWVVLRAGMRRASPQIRYAAAATALVLMVGAVAVTLGREGAGRFSATSAVASMASFPSAESARRPSGSSPPVLFHQGPAAVATASSVEPPPTSHGISPASRHAAIQLPLAGVFIPHVFPWLVSLWGAGSAVLSLRLLDSWRLVRRLRAGAVAPDDAAWQRRFASLGQRLRLGKPVDLLCSASSRVPMVIGWLKPAVVVPTALFNGLAPAQLEAIVAHEFAHIRRHDYLVNFLQTIVETLLFYHPAVWWVSNQLRTERELCCDDVASSICSTPADYARALAALEEIRGSGIVLGIAATGGSLLGRIRRLVKTGEEHVPGGSWPLGVFALVAFLASVPLTLLGLAGPSAASPILVTARDDGAHHIGETRHEAADLVGALKQMAKERPNSSVVIGGASTIPERALTAAVAAGREAGLGFPVTAKAGATEADQTAALGQREADGEGLAKNGAPRHEQTAELLRLWQDEYKEAPRIPAEAMRRLAAQAREYIDRYPGDAAEKMEVLAARLEGDRSWGWEMAKETIDALCDISTAPAGWLELKDQFRAFNRVKPGGAWPAEKLAALPFGPAAPNGLRAAWIFDPMNESYAIGEVLKCRIILLNSGKEPIEFRTDQWHQQDTWHVTRMTGEKVVVKTTRYTGLTPYQRFRLEPGQACEMAGHGVGIGAADYAEQYSTGAIGAEIHATPGDELRCRWDVRVDSGGEPEPEAARVTRISTLTTGDVTFLVTDADPNAAPKIGIARGTGKYDLAPRIKLQVTQVTTGKDGEPTQRTNTATIQWFAGNGEVGLSWPIELMPGVAIDRIVWQRGGTALWILHEKAVRKIDFTNAADVKEQNWKWDEAGNFGGAPADVRTEIERARPAQQTARPVDPEKDEAERANLPRAKAQPHGFTRRLTALEFRLIADEAGEDTEALTTSTKVGTPGTETLHVRKSVVIEATEVASTSWRQTSNDEHWTVGIQLTDTGARKLRHVSKENVGKRLAIASYGRVLSAPTITGEIGDAVEISGRFSEAEARQLARSIRIPGGDAPDAEPSVIEIDKGGAITLNGKATDVAKLPAQLEALTKPRSSVIVIRADGLAAYKDVARVVDLCERAGLSIRLTTSPTPESKSEAAPPKSGSVSATANKAGPGPVIQLAVLDATSQAPIPQFRVVAGVKAEMTRGKEVVNWQPHTVRAGEAGALTWPLDKGYEEMALRVEAEGYAPQVVKWIKKSEGAREVSVPLVKDDGTGGQVVMPNGRPAAGATVALAMVQRDAVIEGGKLRHFGEAKPAKLADQWRWPIFVQADADGRFQLPAENDETAVVLIVHEAGVRELALSEFKRSPEVTLQPWGSLDGRVLWGNTPGSEHPVSLTIHRDTYGYPGVVAQHEKTKSATDGTFAFERVLPGVAQVSCPIASTSKESRITEVNLAGRLTQVTVQPGPTPVRIGGEGRTVKGRLTGSASWDGVTFHFHPTAPHVGLPGDNEMWTAWSEFKTSPSGPLFFRDGLTVNADGTFEIPNVLPGDYQIFFKRAGAPAYLASGKFSVDAETPGTKPEPKNIGEIKASP